MLMLAQSTGPNSALIVLLGTVVFLIVVGAVLARHRSGAAPAEAASGWIALISPPALALVLLAIGVNVKRHADARRLESRIARLESTVAHAEAELLSAADAKRAISRATDETLIVRLPVVEPAPAANVDVPLEKGGRLVVQSTSWRLARSVGAYWYIAWEAVVRNVGDTPGGRPLQVELVDKNGFLVESNLTGTGAVEPGAEQRVTGEIAVLEKAGPLVKGVEATVQEEH